MKHQISKNKISIGKAVSSLPIMLSETGKKIIPEERCFDENSVWWELPVVENDKNPNDHNNKLSLPAGVEWIQDVRDGSVHVVDYVTCRIDPDLVVPRQNQDKSESKQPTIKQVSVGSQTLKKTLTSLNISTQTKAVSNSTNSSQTNGIELEMSQRRFIHRESTNSSSKTCQTEDDRIRRLIRQPLHRFSIQNNDDNDDDARSCFSVQATSRSSGYQINRQMSFSGGARKPVARSNTLINRSSTTMGSNPNSLQKLRQRNPFLNQRNNTNRISAQKPTQNTTSQNIRARTNSFTSYRKPQQAFEPRKISFSGSVTAKINEMNKMIFEKNSTQKEAQQRRSSNISSSNMSKISLPKTQKSDTPSGNESSSENSEYNSGSDNGVSKCISPEIQRKAAILNSNLSSKIVVLTESDSNTSASGSNLDIDLGKSRKSK